MSPLPLPHVHRGKVRDLYAVGEDRLLMVASDRLSAFDVVMAEPVPDKGRVLTAMSAHWFAEIDDVIGNHLISTDVADLPVEVRRGQDLRPLGEGCRRSGMEAAVPIAGQHLESVGAHQGQVHAPIPVEVAGADHTEGRERGRLHSRP